MNQAISQFHKFFCRPETLKAFSGASDTVRRHPNWHALFVLYTNIPKLSALVAKTDEQAFVRDVTAHDENGSLAPEYLARVQGGLMDLLQNPEMLEFAHQQYPALADVLALPSLGWKGYDYLLNESGYRMTAWPSFGVSAFHIQQEKVDAVYIDVAATGFYMERMALPMPPTKPQTFGEELVAIHALATKAAELFVQCEARGKEYHLNAPENCIQQCRDAFRNAAIFEATEMSAA